MIVDLIQPGEAGGMLGGLDLLRRLRPGPPVEVIALTDNDAAWLASAAGTLGASQVVRKPDLRRTAPEHLDRVVRDFLAIVAGEAPPPAPAPADPVEPSGAPAPHTLEALLGAIEELRHMRDRESILLLVLRASAEFVARGLLFELYEDRLRGLGSFGLGEEAAARIGEVSVPLDRDTLPGRAFWSARLQRIAGEGIRDLLPDLPGPLPTSALALPILGTSGVVGILYTDDGGGEALPDPRPLSALVATASLALDRPPSPSLPSHV
jgi:hypothetical protein